MNYPSEANHHLAGHANLLRQSYRNLLGEELLPDIDCGWSKALFNAPFVVLSHDTDADPVFNYANLKGLELFGFSWEVFIQLPSRLSAEPIHQAERERLLAEVNRKGYLASYEGIRITQSGQRFLIKNAVVWNLLSSDGLYAGQAAKFDEWEFL